MLYHGSIPVTDDEARALDRRLVRLFGRSVRQRLGGALTLTRRDPGDSGPLLVSDGRRTYRVDGCKVARA